MTPRTDKLYEEVWRFTNETDAVDALISMRDFCRELERENAALRADIHAHEQINKQLVEDKKRLDWLAVSDVWFDEPATESYTPETFRAEIDRVRKAQP